MPISRSVNRWRKITPVVAVLVVASCAGGSGDVTTGRGSVASVTVTPPVDTLLVSQTVQLTAVAKDASGVLLTDRVVAWSSSANGTATVSGTGLVTAVVAGVVTVSAVIESKTGTASVIVRLVPVATVTVSPATKNLYIGQSTTLTAVARDSAGGILTGRALVWSSSDSTVASVLGGVVTALKTGTATLTASSEGKSGIVQLTISPVPVASVGVAPTASNVYVGQSIPFTAQAKDSVGGTLTGRTITWASSDATVATISAAGMVTGVAAGTATITATSETKSGTSMVTVVPVGPRLVVGVDGVPVGIPTVPLQVKNGDLSVLFNTTVSVNTPLALTTLPPGTYTLTAGPVQVTAGVVAFVYLPPNAQQVQTVSVGQFATTSVLLNYTLRTGAISITASGLPAGTMTACVLAFAPPGVQGIIGAGVQTPSGQTVTVQAYGTGAGTLTCNPVTVANVLYQASPFQQSVTIPASMTPATATVVYTSTP